MRTKADALARIAEDREHWRQLVAAVGEEKMEQPGPMGEWTFKDLAAHLTFWQESTIAKLEAGLDQDAPITWPADLTPYDPADPEQTDWDPINAWVHEQHRDRPVREVLAEADAVYDRLAATIAALPDADVNTPGHYASLGGKALAEIGFNGHLEEEHEADVRAWLAGTSNE
jgi:hypothetical protein